tara:strand:- start:602 stop:1624 length:1023 start_codon:yes stop_codon:yes gene_type:complete
MAFLDNSGDIILDAVLTDLGRKRMANGNFRISKFALGDDEINYSQYDINHPSGSAYSDLQILQTPIFEAVTAQNSAINYGLLSITRTDILYMPSLKINNKFMSAVMPSGGVYYLPVNTETADVVKKATTSPPSPLGSNGEMIIPSLSGMSDKRLYLESGIDAADEEANSITRQALITSTGMLDTAFAVSVDTRFISQVMQLTGQETFNGGENSDTVNIPTMMQPAGGGTATQNLTNFTTFNVRGVDNLLFAPTAGTRDDPSAISGPRGTAMAMTFNVRSELAKTSANTRPNAFTKYGKISQTVFGGSAKFDYIDTIVYISGLSSTATIQVPIRILRYSGA